jgi:SAM-dependent methyltransferase
MGDYESDFEYLRTRSRLALAYRQFWLYPRLKRHLSGRVLDVGCGIGDMLRLRASTVGADINPRLVSYCRSQGLDAHLIENGVLPFADGAFDGAVLDNVLEHLEHPEPVLHEIRRVLRPAGRLIVGVPGRLGYAADPDHKIFYDEAGLTRCLGKAGFVRDRVLHLPIRSAWMDAKLRIYAIYGVFRRT